MRLAIVVILAGAFVASMLVGAATADSRGELRKHAAKDMSDGNYKDAFEQYERLVLDPDTEARQVGNDLTQAVYCLNALNRSKETDALIENAVKVHADNWRLLNSAARLYYNNSHYGCIVSGEYERGSHRGSARYVNSVERDRVRALQLMNRALEAVAERDAGSLSGAIARNEKYELYAYYREFANMVIGYRGYSDSWRLQYVTDLSELPDYGEGYYYWGSSPQGAGRRGRQSRIPQGARDFLYGPKRRRTVAVAHDHGHGDLSLEQDGRARGLCQLPLQPVRRADDVLLRRILHVRTNR